MDDQSYTNQSLEQPNSGKSSSPIKNIITILLLIVTPPIGVLVMWVFTNWSRKIKLIITIAWILLILTATVLVSLPSSGTQRIVNEARITADMGFLHNMLVLLANKEDRPSKINCETDEDFMSICESLKEKTGSEPIIQVSSDRFGDYCAYIQVSSDEYDCFDSSFKKGKTATFPGGTGYCTENSFKCPEVQF